MTDAQASPTSPTPPVTATTAPETSIPPNFSGTKHKIEWEDGNFEELPYEELVSNYKLNKREAAKLQQQLGPAMQFLQSLSSGDLNQLRQIVPEDKLLEFAEQALTQRLEYEQMSPEHKALMQKERELAERERAYKEYEAQIEAQKQEQINQQALAQVQQDIVSAITELGFDPENHRPTPRLIRRVAEQLKAQLEANLPMDARKASRHEWNNITSELSEFQLMMLKKDPAKFVEGLPKEVRKAIRDYDLKASNPFRRESIAKTDDAPETGEIRDFNYLDRLYGDKKKQRKVR